MTPLRQALHTARNPDAIALAKHAIEGGDMDIHQIKALASYLLTAQAACMALAEVVIQDRIDEAAQGGR